jgi:hypothetical protein
MKYKYTSNLQVKEHVYIYFFFEIFYIYLKIYFQNYQNYPLSRYPFPQKIALLIVVMSFTEGEESVHGIERYILM